MKLSRREVIIGAIAAALAPKPKYNAVVGPWFWVGEPRYYIDSTVVTLEQWGEVIELGEDPLAERRAAGFRALYKRLT